MTFLGKNFGFDFFIIFSGFYFTDLNELLISSADNNILFCVQSGTHNLNTSFMVSGLLFRSDLGCGRFFAEKIFEDPLLYLKLVSWTLKSSSLILQKISIDFICLFIFISTNLKVSFYLSIFR